MNREILFRGKRQGSTVWVIGFYNEFASPKTGEQEYFIQTVKPDGRIDVIHKVEPETVGQYTGLRDKNGELIFEGDICRNTQNGGIVSVKWHGTFAGFGWSKRKANSHLSDFGELFRVHDKYEVIGNIHDNPELIGGAYGQI